MSTANKLAKVLETKLNIKQAIIEKGVSVLDTDTFASYPDKIKAISGGGGSTGEGGADKIFVENKSSVEYSKGDKVLVNFVNIDGIDVGDTFSQGTSYFPTLVLTDGTIKIHSSGSQKGYNMVHTPNGFSEKVYPQSVWCYVNYPYLRNGDYITGQCSNNKFTVLNNRTGEATPYDDYPLTDEILLDWDKGILYNNDKSLSYDTGAGNLTNTQKYFQVFGNTIVCSYISEVTFIDISDFPNCTKTVYKLPMTFEKNKCVTGTNVGDYYIGAYKNAYYLMRFNGSGYEYDKMIVTKSNDNGYINIGEGLFGFVETDGTPVAYCLEDGIMKKLDIPVEVVNTIRDDTKVDTYSRQSFSFNKDFSVVSWDWSTGNYNNYSRYAYIKDGASIYISDPESKNFNYNSSLTGYVTGEVDTLGRLEVEICLPEKVELTVNTNIDVNEEDIIFEGAVI